MKCWLHDITQNDKDLNLKTFRSKTEANKGNRFRNSSSRNDNVKKRERLSRSKFLKGGKERKKKNLINYHQRTEARKTVSKQKQLRDCLPGKGFI